jgi:hypothetical protein
MPPWKPGLVWKLGALRPEKPAGGAEKPPPCEAEEPACDPEKPPCDPPRCAPAAIANQAIITATAARRFIGRFYAKPGNPELNSEEGGDATVLARTTPSQRNQIGPVRSCLEA